MNIILNSFWFQCFSIDSWNTTILLNASVTSLQTSLPKGRHFNAYLNVYWIGIVHTFSRLEKRRITISFHGHPFHHRFQPSIYRALKKSFRNINYCLGHVDTLFLLDVWRVTATTGRPHLQQIAFIAPHHHRPFTSLTHKVCYHKQKINNSSI